jgi:hypothetical protein
MMRQFLQLPDTPLLESSYLLKHPWVGVYIRWDVKTTFLNGVIGYTYRNLKVLGYTREKPMYEEGFYGLKQALRAWCRASHYLV